MATIINGTTGIFTDSISTQHINNGSGVSSLDITKLATGGMYTRNIIAQTDTAIYNFTTAWAIGPTFALISNLKSGSLVKLDYTMPCRNDSTLWGGMYIEPQVNLNASGWQSLGSCGYDGAIMNYASPSIGTYYNSILISPGLSVDFSVQFRFYFKSYDGTSTLNGNHDINDISTTAPIMGGTNGLQHFASIIVTEIAKFGGV